MNRGSNINLDCWINLDCRSRRLEKAITDFTPAPMSCSWQAGCCEYCTAIYARRSHPPPFPIDPVIDRRQGTRPCSSMAGPELLIPPLPVSMLAEPLLSGPVSPLVPWGGTGAEMGREFVRLLRNLYQLFIPFLFRSNEHKHQIGCFKPNQRKEEDENSQHDCTRTNYGDADDAAHACGPVRRCRFLAT